MDGWMDKKNQGGKGNPSSILLGIQIYTGICPTSHCDILIHPFTHISNHSFFNLSIYPFIRPFIHQSSPPSIFSHQAIRPYLSIHLSIVLYPQTFSTIHIYIYLFSNHPIIIFPSIYPSVLLPIQHPYTFAYAHHFNSSSIHPFIILPISQSIHPSIQAFNTSIFLPIIYPSTFCYTCSCIEPFIFPYIFSILLSVQSLVHPNNLFIHFSMSDRLTFDLYLYTDRSIYRLIDPTLLPLFSPSIHPTIHRSTVRPIHLSSHPSTHPFLCSAMMKSEQEADSDGVYRAV